MEYLLEASLLNKDKRKRMEEVIYGYYKILEPSLNNYNHYKAFFSKMSDKEFDKFFLTLFSDDMAYLPIHVSEHDFSIRLSDAMKALDYLGISFFEYVVMPDNNGDLKNPTVTAEPVPVGYAHIKRMEQAKSKKNKGSTTATKRSAMTNQVTGIDKNGRMTDSENYNFLINGGEEISKEFMSFRADDMVMYEEALSSIAEKGYVNMNELTDRKENKTALNLVDTFFLGMGLKTNLVTDGLVLPMSLINDR